MSEDVTELERYLKYHFKDKGKLKRALTRMAYAKEEADQGRQCEHQDALCVLGDSVLDAIVTSALLEKGLKERGVVTEKRKDYVKGETLRKRALDLGLHRFVRTNRSEEERREQPRVLAETLEAVIGAIYLDAGYEEASRIVRLLFDV